MKSKKKPHREGITTECSEDKLLPTTDEETGEKVDNNANKVGKKTKALKVLKIILPHLGLTLFIAGYIFVGAAIFQAIETDYDLQVLEDKAKKVVTVYEKIAKKVSGICFTGAQSPPDQEWKTKLFHSLSMVSEAHEGRPYKVNPVNPYNVGGLVKSRWAYLDAFLYSLSILTTTGYTNATPMTRTGQITAIIYGLFGIPLTVLTAVDMGRFLSDVVMFCYAKLAPWWNKFMRFCGCIAAAAKRKVSSSTKIQTALLESNSAANSNARKKSRNPKLPLWANFSILLLFNTLGAFLYMAHGETKPDFLEAFFVCFNLVANLTMGEIPVVRDIVMVIYIAFFVTFGLAVLSMCADLAASELKWLFLKIHYFGRRIRKKRKLLAEVAPYMEDIEVKELLKIIDEIRTRFPSKHKVTHQDILDYIQHNYDAPGEYSMSKRRDTIAFMPEGMDVLKFADADDVDDSSMRIIPSVPDITDDPIEYA